MSERGITPEWFANALRTLEARSPASTDPGNASTYISTHPASQQRIDAALDAARGFDPLEVIVAKQMAESEGAGETVDAARVAGCWIGKRPTGEKRFSQWEVSFGEDGAVAAHFLVLDGNDSILDTYISYLRSKVDRGFTPRLIHTVRGMGYRIANDESD